ncbi:kinase-like domain-containing protein [Dipodascopsis tothii]|uniref:kinase-like domain-containing protein n=1 Tax=Dipodascopsis tothii TaxID=44089 RepID=UPI0034CDAE95
MDGRRKNVPARIVIADLYPPGTSESTFSTSSAHLTLGIGDGDGSSRPSSVPPEAEMRTEWLGSAPVSRQGSQTSAGPPTIVAQRPAAFKFRSLASQFHSPTRHNRRTQAGPREVKETLNASISHQDGVRVLNQYALMEQVGHGSYGAVSRARDMDTNATYAVKEFSKQRLRRHNRTQQRARGLARARANVPRPSPADQKDVDLIRSEIASLKKLNHVNVANLIEVLDNPHEDSLYMVLEWCGKGVIMSVSMDHVAEPYDEEQCRLYFRDLIMGIEYLHAQGIVHRDIKPDNLLLSDDDVLKIVDFGVSEMFEKDNDAMVRVAGTPPYLAPELCTVPQAEYSGRAADIWAMGVTLYCLLFGELPFRGSNLVDLYASIRHDELVLPDEASPQLKDLFRRILDKDYRRRIKMPELRRHPWVTLEGIDELLPEHQNTGSRLPEATEEELRTAFNGIQGVFDVVRAANRLQRHHTAGSPRYEPTAWLSDSSPSGEATPQGPEEFYKNSVIMSLKVFHAGLKVRLDKLNLYEELESERQASERRKSETASATLQDALVTPRLPFSRSRSLDVFDRMAMPTLAGAGAIAELDEAAPDETATRPIFPDRTLSSRPASTQDGPGRRRHLAPHPHGQLPSPDTMAFQFMELLAEKYSMKDYFLIFIIVSGYLLFRPQLVKLGGTLQKRGLRQMEARDKKAAEEAAARAASQPEPDNDTFVAESSKQSWGRHARRRQTDSIKKLERALERKAEMEQEDDSDKEIEDLLED